MNENDMREEFHEAVGAKAQAEVPPDPPAEVESPDPPESA